MNKEIKKMYKHFWFYIKASISVLSLEKPKAVLTRVKVTASEKGASFKKDFIKDPKTTSP